MASSIVHRRTSIVHVERLSFARDVEGEERSLEEWYPDHRDIATVRYLVTARVKPGREGALAQAIENGSLGAGSIAHGEYRRNMECARLLRDGSVKWVEVCYCGTPLEEERPYWEEYFDLVKVQDAHARDRCKDLNGSEPWACSDCDCTDKLEARLTTWGPLFLEHL
jgi:hypothetical protein